MGVATIEGVTEGVATTEDVLLEPRRPPDGEGWAIPELAAGVGTTGVDLEPPKRPLDVLVDSGVRPMEFRSPPRRPSEDADGVEVGTSTETVGN